MIPYVFSDNTLTLHLHLQGRPHPLDRTHPNWDEVVRVLPTASEDELLKLVSIKTHIESLRIGKVTIGEETIYYDGKPVHSHLTTRMLEIVKQGLPVEPWARFMDNLYQNPSNTAIEELYLWLEKSNLPITEDGHFLAYKKVQHDYTSFHDKTTKNNIGTIVSMPRNQVDDRRDNTCSHGLHFCSWDYLPHYYGNQGRVVVLKINPADVVSIPSDYNNAKGRAWQYSVISEVPENEAKHAFPQPVYFEEEEDDQDDQDDQGDDAFYGDWQYEVSNGYTKLGYVEWLKSNA